MSTDTLYSGDRLNDQPGWTIVSSNGGYSFILKTDSVLCLKDNSTGLKVWHSTNPSLPGSNPVCTMQPDGILTVKINSGTGATVWQSGNPVSNGAHLQVRNQGDVVLFDINGNVIWSTSP